MANRILFTQAHRELWARYAGDSELHRVKDPIVDLANTPIRLKEHEFVTAVIQHFATCHHAYENDVFVMPQAIGADIKEFFTFPIPGAVWKASKAFHDKNFVAYVERHLNS